MAQYINRFAVVAKIEKLNPPFYPTLAEKSSYRDAVKDCIDIIDTLEVKEIQKKNLYVVTRCEEHSDYVEKAFFSKEKAENYCKQFEGNEDAYGRDITEIEVDYPLEVKEVDLDKEITSWAHELYEIPYDDVERMAKYFFELAGKPIKQSNRQVNGR